MVVVFMYMHVLLWNNFLGPHKIVAALTPGAGGQSFRHGHGRGGVSDCCAEYWTVEQKRATRTKRANKNTPYPPLEPRHFFITAPRPPSAAGPCGGGA